MEIKSSRQKMFLMKTSINSPKYFVNIKVLNKDFNEVLNEDPFYQTSLSIGAGEGVLEVPKVPKIPKAPKVPKDVAPFIVLILMSKSK